MSRKKWLIALAIVAVLAVAFFWGGDRPQPGREAAPATSPSGVAAGTASPAAPQGAASGEQGRAAANGTAAAGEAAPAPAASGGAGVLAAGAT
ncbi:hypothetical protein ABE452_21440, partial [Paenibacillus ferrarius]